MLTKLLSRKALIRYLSLMYKMGWLPIRKHMGGGKGTTISRYYVHRFMLDNAHLLCGDVLEVGRSVYRDLLPAGSCRSYTCLDRERQPDVDIVADIQDLSVIRDGSYDSILCTQVLEHVPNPFLATRELHRITRPGGRLLITVPFLNNLHMEPDDYWRFTEHSLRLLLVPFGKTTITTYGDTYRHVLATLGVVSTELKIPFEGQEAKSEFPIIVAAVAER